MLHRVQFWSLKIFIREKHFTTQDWQMDVSKENASPGQAFNIIINFDLPSFFKRPALGHRASGGLFKFIWTLKFCVFLFAQKTASVEVRKCRVAIVSLFIWPWHFDMTCYIQASIISLTFVHIEALNLETTQVKLIKIVICKRPTEYIINHPFEVKKNGLLTFVWLKNKQTKKSIWRNSTLRWIEIDHSQHPSPEQLQC